MGSYVKDNELYRKLSNEVQQNFGKIQPVGKFLNDNAKIVVEVIDEQTLRISYRSMVYYSSQQMLPIINEVEYKNAKKAAEDIIERIAEKVNVKIKLREEFANEFTQMVLKEPETSQRRAYYRWSTLADVAPTKKSEN